MVSIDDFSTLVNEAHYAIFLAWRESLSVDEYKLSYVELADYFMNCCKESGFIFRPKRAGFTIWYKNQYHLQFVLGYNHRKKQFCADKNIFIILN